MIVISSTQSAYASPSVGGWTAVDTVIAGATTTINATKSIGGKLMQSAVTVAPSATKLGKHLLRGGGAAALALAVPQLLGDGVDWVLDPANNSVRYTDPTASADPDPNHPSVQYIWTNYTGADFPSAVAACKAAIVSFNQRPNKPYTAVFSHVKGNDCYNQNALHDRLISRLNPAYDPDAPAPPDGSAQDRHLPIEAVAQQVISEAESGNVPSQEAVKAAALEGFASGEHDAALEAGATESETGTDNPPDTTDPANPADPAEPFDPAGIISAINALKALLAGILSSITSLSDMFGDTPSNPENTDVPIDDAPPVRAPNDFDVEYINFGGQCPTLPSFDVGIGGASTNMAFDMSPLCDLAVKIRPAIIGIAYFIGLGIIASAIRET